MTGPRSSRGNARQQPTRPAHPLRHLGRRLRLLPRPAGGLTRLRHLLRRLTLVDSLLKAVGVRLDTGTWVEAGAVLACAYPRREPALALLASRRVTLLINLHARPHAPARLARYGLTELHLPVADFTPPTPEQIERGVAAIAEAAASGRRVAVHCGAGLGRTGTLLACYLVSRGREPDAAIGQVRRLRPGSIETREQVEAVHAYARRLRP